MFGPFEDPKIGASEDWIVEVSELHNFLESLEIYEIHRLPTGMRWSMLFQVSLTKGGRID
jgi:hypothetical protein